MMKWYIGGQIGQATSRMGQLAKFLSTFPAIAQEIAQDFRVDRLDTHI